MRYLSRPIATSGASKISVHSVPLRCSQSDSKWKELPLECLFLRSFSQVLPFLFFFLIIRRPPRSTLFPSPTLFRSPQHPSHVVRERARLDRGRPLEVGSRHLVQLDGERKRRHAVEGTGDAVDGIVRRPRQGDRKSTRLNSSHSQISYAAFCLKKKYLQNGRHPTDSAETLVVPPQDSSGHYHVRYVGSA